MDLNLKKKKWGATPEHEYEEHPQGRERKSKIVDFMLAGSGVWWLESLTEPTGNETLDPRLRHHRRPVVAAALCRAVSHAP